MHAGRHVDRSDGGVRSTRCEGRLCAPVGVGGVEGVVVAWHHGGCEDTGAGHYYWVLLLLDTGGRRGVRTG